MNNQEKLNKKRKIFKTINIISFIVGILSLILAISNDPVRQTIFGWLFIIAVITDTLSSILHKKYKNKLNEVQTISMAIEDNKRNEE